MSMVLARDRAGVTHLTREFDFWPLCTFNPERRRRGWEPGDVLLTLTVWDRGLEENEPLTCLFCLGGHHAK